MNFTRKDFDLNDEYMRRRQQEAQHEHLVQLVQFPNMDIRFTLAKALKVCQSIQKENMAKWYAPAAWQCRLCMAQARDGIPARLVRHPQVCGCPSVAARLQQALQVG